LKVEDHQHGGGYTTYVNRYVLMENHIFETERARRYNKTLTCLYNRFASEYSITDLRYRATAKGQFSEYFVSECDIFSCLLFWNVNALRSPQVSWVEDITLIHCINRTDSLNNIVKFCAASRRSKTQ